MLQRGLQNQRGYAVWIRSVAFWKKKGLSLLFQLVRFLALPAGSLRRALGFHPQLIQCSTIQDSPLQGGRFTRISTCWVCSKTKYGTRRNHLTDTRPSLAECVVYNFYFSHYHKVYHLGVSVYLKLVIHCAQVFLIMFQTGSLYPDEVCRAARRACYSDSFQNG